MFSTTFSAPSTVAAAPKSAARARTNSNLLHMDECQDPDCADLEQLREFQKSIDKFTDYNHYEKCCDGTHARGEACNGHLECCDDDCSEECEECVDECCEDECFNDFDAMLASPECDDECEACEEECEEQGHERKECPQNHHTSWESCITTCGVCVDPTPLPLLGGETEYQLAELNYHLPHAPLRPCDESCTPPPMLEEALGEETMMDEPIPMVDLQPSAFDINLDHWQTFQQGHHCAPDPCLMEHQFQPPEHVDPQFGFSFGCDPRVPGHQYPWQTTLQQQICNVSAFSNLDLGGLAHNMNAFTPVDFSIPEQSTDPGQILTTLASAVPSIQIKAKSPAPQPRTGRQCQWLMPCGSVCGQTFGRTDDLKKHVKNSHLSLKGTVTCRWGSACTASFGSEAALTGHISKKHLAPLYAAASATTTNAGSRSPTVGSESQAEELPWKCTFPGCNKAFQYKQVRDEHVSSHTGGNLQHCPICHKWLNAEGSNFKRHLLSHRPEEDHMNCKHSHLGCRRKFPRLDNLRRHEACCKYGKKAAASAQANGAPHAHHHHHHNHRIARA